MFSFFRRKKSRSPAVISKRREYRTRSEKRRRRESPTAADEYAATSLGWRVSYVFLWLCFLTTLCYLVFFSPWVTFQEFSLEGTQALPEEITREAVRENLQGKYWGFLPHNTFFVLSERQVAQNLSQRFRTIRVAQVEKTFPRQLTIRIEERETLLVWCSGGPCFSIDEQGVAYDGYDGLPETFPAVGGVRAGVEETNTGNDWLKIVDTSGAPLSLSAPVLEESFIRLALTIRNRLREETGLETSGEYTTPARLSNELRIPTQEGWELIIDTARPLDSTIKALQLLLAKELMPDKRERLKYVDLRAENRAYYAYKDDGSLVARDQSDGGDSEKKESEDKKKKK